MLRVRVPYADGPNVGSYRSLDVPDLNDGLRFIDLDERRIVHRYVVEGGRARLVESLSLDEYTGQKAAA